MVDPTVTLEEPEPDLDEPNIRRRSSTPPAVQPTSITPQAAPAGVAQITPGRVQSHDYAVATSPLNEKTAQDATLALATSATVTPTSSNESDYPNEKAVGPDTLQSRTSASALNPGVGITRANLSTINQLGDGSEAPHTGPLGGEKPKVKIIEPTWKQSFTNAIKGAPILCGIPILLPIAWALHLSNQNPIAVFVTSLLCIVPLAAGLGFATEELALRIGEAWGGLLNATFGNVTELLIAIIALVHGEIEIVQAAMIGSILSNLLLVLGMSYFAGGLRFHEQMYFIPAAQMQISLLGLTIMAIALPAAYHWAYPSPNSSTERFGSELVGEELEVILRFSRGLSFILLATYAMFLCFQLWTHAYLFRLPRDIGPHDHPEGPMPVHDRVFPVPDWVPSLADSSSSEGSISSGRSGHTARSNNPFKKFRRWSTSRSTAPMSPATVDLERQDSSEMARVRFDDHDGTRPVSPASLGPAAMGDGAIYNEPQVALPEGTSTSTAPTGGIKGILRPRLPAKIASAKLPTMPTMPRLPRAPENEDEDELPPIEPQVRWYFALGMLVLMTVLAGVSAEFLVDSIDGLVAESNVSRQFVGLILLPVIGNAVEHVTAVTVSVKDKLNLSMSIAVGSSIQVSLCILPILVLIGWAIGQPLTLYFDAFETIALIVSVLLVNFAISDGRTNYLEGFVMMMAYVSIALVCWFYDPENTSGR